MLGAWVAAARARLAGFDVRSRGSRLTLTITCAVLLCVGAGLIIVGLTSQTHPPQPSPAQGIAETPRAALTSSRTSHSAAGTAATTHRASTTRSTNSTSGTLPVPPGYGADPVQITIPSIHVHADVMLLGLAADHSVQTPPLSRVGTAGWYRYSPTPGALGPSIMLGHVDSAVYGKGVFFDLGAMHRGDSISVLRADHKVATFAVTQVSEYPKKSFPTATVYGNTANPQIRLITCGGRFDSHKRSYVDNIVVYASLTSLRHA